MANESMIAACPKCAARYRLARARLRSEGVRLRCSRCEAVFRVTPPASASTPAEAPAPHSSREAPAPSPQVSNTGASLAAPREMASAAPEVVAPQPKVSAPSPSLEAALGSREPKAPAQAAAAPVLPRTASVVPPTAAGSATLAGSPAPRPDLPGQPRSEAERAKLVLLADSEVEAGKGLANTLASWGLEPLLVHDGVEAILTIQRALPRLVILDAALPKMFGFQICEFMKRNESLRSIHVVLIGAIHHRDRYRRAPSEIYGADAYAERPDLPEALRPILSRFGLPVGTPTDSPDSPPVVEAPLQAPEVSPLPEPKVEFEPAPEPLLEVDPAPDTPLEPLDVGTDHDFDVLDVDDDSFAGQGPLEPVAGDLLAEPVPLAPESLAEPEPPTLQPPVAADANALEPPTAELPLQVAAPEPADPAVSAAERLARIIVSDVVLYNPEKFEQGVRAGNVVELLDTELDEGRGLFDQRVAPELRTGRDFLAEELVRVARSKGMQA